MSANLQSGMFAGKPAWHGLGNNVEKELTAAEAIKASGLDWAVEKRQVFFQTDEGKGRKVPNQFATVRTDTQQALGTVGRVYMPLQNADAFSFADSIIQEKAAVYNTAGALGNGEKIWVLAKLDGVCTIGGDDVVDKYLLLANSHNGSSGVQICLTPVRVVCQNTLAAALGSAQQMFKIRHTASMGSKVTDARHALGIANKFFAEFEEKAQALTRVQMNADKFKGFIKAAGFDPEAEQGRAKSSADDLWRLFETGKGQDMPSARGTAWGAYNAVTEYLTHHRPTRVTNGFKSEREARLNSLWFGAGQGINAKALKAAEDLISA